MSTEAIHAGEMHDPSGAHIDPVHMTSTYVFEDVDAIGSWARGENEGAPTPPWASIEMPPGLQSGGIPGIPKISNIPNGSKIPNISNIIMALLL